MRPFWRFLPCRKIQSPHSHEINDWLSKAKATPKMKKIASRVRRSPADDLAGGFRNVYRQSENELNVRTCVRLVGVPTSSVSVEAADETSSPQQPECLPACGGR